MKTKDILEKFKNVAVIGMSANEMKPSHSIPMFMMSVGYNIYPVNPTLNEIRGLKSYPSLLDVEEKIEIVNVFQRSEKCLAIVEEAVERKSQKGDVEVIWLQEGIINNEAKNLAEFNGIIFVQDVCMFKEYHKNFK